MLNVDLSYAFKTRDEKKEQALFDAIKKAHHTIERGDGAGSDFLGWLDLPNQMLSDVNRINDVAKRLSEKHDVLLVIGIGGSYLGSKAVIESLKPYFSTDQDIEIIFVGHHISSDYMSDLKAYLKEKSFAINVISKSGTTTEPAIAFRTFKALLEEKVGPQEAKNRIVATTDQSKGALKTLADEKGYETFVIPDDVGGRYSVLTAVGLLPVAAAGIDIEALLTGAQKAKEALNEKSPKNQAYQYVMARHYLYQHEKMIEMLIYYEPKLKFVAEWWKQLFGESEGKENKGLFNASAGFTTDLHSLGQYIQEGHRHLFETIINIKQPNQDFNIELTKEDLDGLNYLSDMTVDTINKKAMQGTLLAHMDGDAPSIVIDVERLDAEHIGSLLYFFEFSCALSGYVLGINPFDQPGVEAYKKNMFALLKKPGFENETKSILNRIKKTRE